MGADIKRSLNTFEAVTKRFIVEYLEAKGRRPATVQQYRWLFEGTDLGSLRSRPIADIAVEDVEAVLAGIFDRGSPIAANRALAYLRKLFTWALRRRIITSSPAMVIDYPSGETPRDRVLDDSELRKIWRALDADPGLINPVGKLLILTGQRCGEVAGMRLSEIHGLSGAQPTWELPGRRTKNHRDHVVPLTPQVLRIVKSMVPTGDLVFSNNGKVPILVNAKLRDRIAKAAGVTGWSWHDLRRTFATGLGRLKVPRFIIGKVINHADRSVTAIYERHEFLDEKLEALTKWADHLDRLLARLCT
jgi:integrase